jgi:putative ABC transport system ATP-binding protein
MNENASKVLIEVKDLGKTYHTEAGDIKVLEKVNFQVRTGEMMAIMGPSGSGKSTLLFILGLFLSPTSGQYLLDGEDTLTLDRSGQARFRRWKMGFVFQSTDLLENSTVYENLEFPMIYAQVERSKRPERIAEVLDLVGLSHRVNHPSNLLSGGERQRAAVARALVNHPKVILADEPTGQLDKKNTDLIMEHFAKIAKSSGTAVIMVTHDPEVADWCNRVCSLTDGCLS